MVKQFSDYGTHKKCSVCKKLVPVSGFEFMYGKAVNSRGKNRLLKSYCKSCRSENRNLMREMVSNCKARAKRRGLDFDLDYEFIIELNNKQNGLCIYTGIPLNWKPGKGKGQRWCPADRASMDRIDPAKGYTKDNVQLVTDFANRFKTYMSHEDIVVFAKRIIASLET